jgi:UDP-2,3-diacylglucosamine pyrophosphatase LpxH
MTHEARRRGCDGVVCGHIHKAEVSEMDGIVYCNDGDWVESLTALVETFEGELRLIHWRNRLTEPLNLGRIVDELQEVA